MKKKYVLIPCLLPVAVTPLISFVGCESKPNPPKNDFYIDDGEMTTANTTSIKLQWLAGDSRTISNPKFTYGSKEAKEITLREGDVGYQNLDLTFNEDITDRDITNGILSFHYKNNESGAEYNAEVVNIHITKLPFNKDTWKNICSWADQGLNSLKQHYGVDTFVGEKKDITVAGFKYQVIVVGEGEDYLANEDGTASDTPAALSLMFKTAIQEYDSQSESYKPYVVNFVSGEGRKAWEDDLWHNSIPMEYLLNTFLPELKEALEYEGAIKTVSKNTISVFETGNVSASSEQLFLPSLADIFSSKIETFELPSVGADIENQQAFIQEGNFNSAQYHRYSYFEKIIEQGFNFPHQELAVYDGIGTSDENEVSYWFRSCDPSHSSELAKRVEWIWYSGYNSESNEGEDRWRIYPASIRPTDESTNLFGFAPIFCI